MTKVFFNAVAKGIRNSTIGIDGLARELLAQNVAFELSEKYPRFNTDMFVDACCRASDKGLTKL